MGKAKAAAWYLIAKGGNQNAQCNLGHLYVNGAGVAQDFKKSAKWLWEAASKGESAAIEAALDEIRCRRARTPDSFVSVRRIRTKQDLKIRDGVRK